jgi:hypothetical protein
VVSTDVPTVVAGGRGAGARSPARGQPDGDPGLTRSVGSPSLLYLSSVAGPRLSRDRLPLAVFPTVALDTDRHTHDYDPTPPSTDRGQAQEFRSRTR